MQFLKNIHSKIASDLSKFWESGRRQESREIGGDNLPKTPKIVA
jgi:hypothetical protein